MNYFLITFFIIYLAYTLNFAIKFNNAQTYLTDNQKLYHNILIWLISFFWIIIVKGIIRPTPGSGKFKKTKSDPGFYESGIGFWGYGEGQHHGNDSGGSDGGEE